jgi:hypothetical protein
MRIVRQCCQLAFRIRFYFAPQIQQTVKAPLYHYSLLFSKKGRGPKIIFSKNCSIQLPNQLLEWNVSWLLEGGQGVTKTILLLFVSRIFGPPPPTRGVRPELRGTLVGIERGNIINEAHSFLFSPETTPHPFQKASTSSERKERLSERRGRLQICLY